MGGPLLRRCGLDLVRVGASSWEDRCCGSAGGMYTLLLQCVLLRVGSAEARAGRCGMLGDVVHSRRVVLSVAAAEAAGESQGDHLE